MANRTRLSYHTFSDAENILMYCGYGGITFLSIFGNALVVFVVATRVSFRKSIPNLFILNLALADCLTGALAIPFKFVAAKTQQWIFPRIFCNLVPFMETVTLSVSVFSLLSISVDRVRVMMKRAKKQMSRQFAAAVILTIWVSAIAMSVPYGYFHRVHVVNNRTKVAICSNADVRELPEWRVYNVYLTIIQYFVPVFVVDGVYCYIAYKVWSTKPATVGNDADKFERNKHKVVKMLLIVVTVFTFCWLPYEIYLVLAEIKPEVNQYHYINVIFFCSHWLAMSNSCLNPIIYGVYNAKFQKEYKEVFKCIFRPCFPKAMEQQLCSEDEEAKRLNDFNNSQPLIDNINSKSPLSSKHNYRHQYIASELGRDSE